MILVFSYQSKMIPKKLILPNKQKFFFWKIFYLFLHLSFCKGSLYFLSPSPTFYLLVMSFCFLTLLLSVVCQITIGNFEAKGNGEVYSRSITYLSYTALLRFHFNFSKFHLMGIENCSDFLVGNLVPFYLPQFPMIIYVTALTSNLSPLSLSLGKNARVNH